MSSIFGGGGSKPKAQEPQPIQVDPSANEKADMIKLLAMRNRATILNNINRQPKIQQQKLGAMV